MNLKFLKFWNNPSNKIKRRIQYKALSIILYSYNQKDPVKKESNIYGLDLNGNILWNAENCNSGRYFDMQIDETNNTLEAQDGSGMFYEIELKEGKIIREELRK